MPTTLRSSVRGRLIEYQSAAVTAKERARREEQREKLPPPEFGEDAVDLDSLPVEWLANREQLHAYAAGLRMSQFAAAAFARDRVPLDMCWQAAELVGVFVEFQLLTWVKQVIDDTETPQIALFPECDGTDEDGNPCLNRRLLGARLCPECQEAEERARPALTEIHAMAAGLTICHRCR